MVGGRVGRKVLTPLLLARSFEERVLLDPGCMRLLLFLLVVASCVAGGFGTSSFPILAPSTVRLGGEGCVCVCVCGGERFLAEPLQQGGMGDASGMGEGGVAAAAGGDVQAEMRLWLAVLLAGKEGGAGEGGLLASTVPEKWKASHGGLEFPLAAMASKRVGLSGLLKKWPDVVRIEMRDSDMFLFAGDGTMREGCGTASGEGTLRIPATAGSRDAVACCCRSNTESAANVD